MRYHNINGEGRGSFVGRGEERLDGQDGEIERELRRRRRRGVDDKFINETGATAYAVITTTDSDYYTQTDIDTLKGDRGRASEQVRKRKERLDSLILTCMYVDVIFVSERGSKQKK